MIEPGHEAFTYHNTVKLDLTIQWGVIGKGSVASVISDRDNVVN